MWAHFNKWHKHNKQLHLKKRLTSCANPGSSWWWAAASALPLPDPPHMQEPSPCGNESGCPTQLGMHEPCTNTAFPGSELQLQRKKFTLPPFKPSPWTFSSPWSPLQPHHTDTQRANYHPKHTLPGHSKICLLLFGKIFILCATGKGKERDRKTGK